MKSLAQIISLIAILFFFWSCNENSKTSQNNPKTSPIQPDDLIVGGLYLLKNKDNTYYVTKALVIDDFAIHLRTYRDTFKTKPIDINSQNLKILIGHAPLDKTGFLADKPELLKVEDVKESELEGYKMYLEAMKNN